MPCNQLREPTLSLTMLVDDRPEAFSPRIAAKASPKSPVEIPLRYSAGINASTLGVRRINLLDPTPPGRELGDRYRVKARILTWHGGDVLQVPVGALFRRGRV